MTNSKIDRKIKSVVLGDNNFNCQKTYAFKEVTSVKQLAEMANQTENEVKESLLKIVNSTELTNTKPDNEKISLVPYKDKFNYKNLISFLETGSLNRNCKVKNGVIIKYVDFNS